MAQIGGTPIFILREGTERKTGKSAKEENLASAIAVCEMVRSSLGPKGMNKLLVDSLGDITITNDGKTILDEIEVAHPAAKMMVEIAKTQHDKVGDGTTTCVIITGELLKRARDLINQGIHPNVVFHGFRKAMVKSEQILNEISKKVEEDDISSFHNVAKTAMNSKNIAGAQEIFAEIATSAIMQVRTPSERGFTVDFDNIQIIKKAGKSIKDTELIQGLIIDKEVVHSGMPKRIQDARIALTDAALEIEKTEIDAEVRVKNPAQLQGFIDNEEQMLKSMVDKIAAAGANVVFVQKGIDDTVQDYLAKLGILAVRRVKRSDMEKLTRATNGKIITRLEDLDPDSLGTAGLIEEKKVSKDNMIFITGCQDPKAVSILVRGAGTHIVEEADRCMHDALSAVKVLVEMPEILPGGGATQIELSKRLLEYAGTIGGKEQLAIEQYADALESIPKTLAENGGMDPMEVLTNLKAHHEEEGGLVYGLNLFSGQIENMEESAIVEPKNVFLQALHSATEVANMIVKIDDVIIASKVSKGPKTPQNLDFED